MIARAEINALLKKLDVIAPTGYFLSLHIRFAAPLMRFQTYPETWAEFYFQNGFALRDPTIAWGLSTTGACRWSALPVPDPFGIMREAAGHGLPYGATLSHGLITSRSIASVANGKREFTDEEIVAVSAILRQLHELAEPPAGLTKAQKDALRRIAEGERHAEAAAKLGITESAFKARLISTRKRLMARTTAEALQRAQEYRLL
ncbi:helix-turn-helix transcriptional regulator [Paracoccus saliphilus]|uniref:Autoinducer binding domain-containing protein n=1 Tax=Paracoccus saliphilus TaxID=405559 RepID=A0AA46A665_9RHOB|nr:autoinducer binding domain-containing protein [Paracoccus saliphilus]WCR02268.1 autoinducer binding domain-containing protein [Paracoccus saliphilus]SIS92871.1 LuxR family transcriptional regulator [Paracoccus saliphilus]